MPKKKDIELPFHADPYDNPVFAVNVKCHRYLPAFDMVATDKGKEIIEERVREDFWQSAVMLAQDIFGPGHDVSSAGRSGGWMVPHPSAESGFTVAALEGSRELREKCERFHRRVNEMMACLDSDVASAAIRYNEEIAAEAKEVRKAAEEARIDAALIRAALVLLPQGARGERWARLLRRFTAESARDA